MGKLSCRRCMHCLLLVQSKLLLRNPREPLSNLVATVCASSCQPVFYVPLSTPTLLTLAPLLEFSRWRILWKCSVCVGWSMHCRRLQWKCPFGGGSSLLCWRFCWSIVVVVIVVEVVWGFLCDLVMVLGHYFCCVGMLFAIFLFTNLREGNTVCNCGGVVVLTPEHEPYVNNLRRWCWIPVAP